MSGALFVTAGTTQLRVAGVDLGDGTAVLRIAVDAVNSTGRVLTDAGVWAFGDPITPNDGADIANAPARGLDVVVAGDVHFAVLRSDGVTRYEMTRTYAAKDVIPYAVYRVYATGTTATVNAGF